MDNNIYQNSTMNLGNIGGGIPYNDNAVASIPNVEQVVPPTQNFNNVATTIPQQNEQVAAPVYQTAPAQNYSVVQEPVVTPAQQIPAQQIPAMDIPQPVVAPVMEQPQVATAPVIEEAPQTAAQPIVDQTAAQPVVEQPQVVTPVEPITTDKYVIKTETLRTFLKNAGIAAIGESMIQITTVIQFMFANDGLYVYSTDADNTLTQVDRSVRFSNELSVAVSSDLITKLIDKIDTEYIELKPDFENKIVNVCSGPDEFKIKEIYDTSEGVSLSIEDKYTVDGLQGIVLDVELFKETVKKASVLVSSPSVHQSLAGVYCGQNIVSTDGQYMFSTKNQPAISNEQFYLSNKFINILKNITFDSSAKLYLIKDTQGVNSAIVIKSDNMTLSGPLDANQQNYPIDTIMDLMSKPLQYKFTLKKSKVLSILNKAKLFIDPNSDKYCCHLKLDGATNKILITDFTGHVKQYVDVVSDNLPSVEFNLHIDMAGKTFENFISDELVCSLNSDTDADGSFLRVDADNIGELLTMMVV